MRALFFEKTDYIEEYLFRIFVWQLRFAAITFPLCFTGNIKIPAGWLGGITFNIAYLLMLWLSAYTRRYDPPVVRGNRLAGIASARFFLAVLFLTLTVKIGSWHIGAAVCGLLSLQVVYYLDTFCNEFKNRLR